MNYEDKYYYLGFSYFQKIGPASMKKLEQNFTSICQAYFANANELRRAGLNESLINSFISWRKSPFASIENMVKELEKEKISYLTWKDLDYPALLKEIATPPFVIFYKGNITDNNCQRLAIVGSRNFSAYGEKVIFELLPKIINSKITIISGLALGIDALAHHKTLELGGLTWAVLGSGLAIKSIYPAANQGLAEHIVSRGGALLSEFPPSTPPYKQNFPRRNRIIAGLAQATLVVEAKKKSGALITANWALEENREVLAIPGSIFAEFSTGPNVLIKLGAKTVTTASDILEIYGLNENTNLNQADKTKIQPNKELPYSFNSGAEKIIYKILKRVSERTEKISADEIIRETNLDTSIINSTLSILEIRGIAKNNESGYDLY